MDDRSVARNLGHGICAVKQSGADAKASMLMQCSIDFLWTSNAVQTVTKTLLCWPVPCLPGRSRSLASYKRGLFFRWGGRGDERGRETKKDRARTRS